MNTFEIIALLHVITGVLAYINHRFFKLPPAIGLMLISMLVSIPVLVLQGLTVGRLVKQLVGTGGEANSVAGHA